MTFIASIPTTESVVMVSDSRETISRTVLPYDDLIDLLKHPDLGSFVANGAVDESKLQTSWAEKFIALNEPKDGVQKIYQLSDFSAIQIAGTVEYSGTTVVDIIKRIKSQLESDTDALYGSEFADFVLAHFKPFLPDHSKSSEGKLSDPAVAHDASYILSSFDPENGIPHVSLFKYISDGKFKGHGFDYSFGIEQPRIQYTMYVGGSGANNTCVQSLKSVNPKLPLTTERGLDILSAASMLSLLWERLNNRIHEVGGCIRFAIIDASGYREFDAPIINWHS